MSRFFTALSSSSESESDVENYGGITTKAPNAAK